MNIDLVSVAVDTHQTLKLIPIVIRNLKPTNIQILDFTSTPGETLKVILTEDHHNLMLSAYVLTTLIPILKQGEGKTSSIN